MNRVTNSTFRSVNGNTKFDSERYCVPANAKFVGPVFYALGFSFKRYIYVISPVPNLFEFSGPVAIFRRIGTVIVASFNRMLRAWPSSHVSIEVFKRVEPPIANFYSSASVKFVLVAFWISASLNNTLPASVLKRFTHAVRCKFFALKTSTALGYSASHISKDNCYFNAAVTDAKPHGFTVFVDVRELDCGKPTESLTRNVLESRSSFLVNRISHKSNSLLFLVKAHFQRLTGDGLALVSGVDHGGAT